MLFKKLLLAYNGTDEGKSGLLACSEMAALADREIHLLSVAGFPNVAVMADGLPITGMLESQNTLANEILNAGVEQLRQKGFAVTGHLAVGHPVDEICRMARMLSVDLIVVGHKKKSSFASRWWAGSLGKSLLDHAPCSVYVALVHL